MKPFFLFRLLLDLLAAGLLFVGLAYWWLGNLAHELAGTAMFLLLVSHNVFNRRWYGAIGKAPGDRRRLTVLVLNGLLLAAILALLATSLLISQSLFTFLPQFGAVTARDIHILAAYWMLVIAGLHVGSNWALVINATRRLLRIDGKSPARTWLLRAVALAVAIQGLRSSFALGIGTRLHGGISLDFFWDFETDAAGFFLHLLAIFGLYACLGHVASVMLSRMGRNQI